MLTVKFDAFLEKYDFEFGNKLIYLIVDFRAVFLGTKGVDITKLNETLQPLYSVQTIQGGPEAISETNIEAFLKLERTTALINVAEKTSSNVWLLD